MIREELLAILRCPIDRQSLRIADTTLIEQINESIAAGQLSNRASQRVEFALDQGLIREDGKLLYPVVDDIPKLVADEAIPLESFTPHSE